MLYTIMHVVTDKHSILDYTKNTFNGGFLNYNIQLIVSCKIELLGALLHIL